jgi:hypothetical protein
VSIGVGVAIRHALAVFLVLVGVLDIPAELSAGLPTLFVMSVAAVRTLGFLRVKYGS